MFFHHPKKVCMTHFSHMKFSLSLSNDFFKASTKAFIHAVYPDAYITSSTDAIKDIEEKMNTVGCKKAHIEN